MARPIHPSNRERQALIALWHEGSSTVTAAYERLPDRKNRAKITILSVMRNLKHKSMVKCAHFRRNPVDAAAYSEEFIVQRATHGFLTNSFGTASVRRSRNPLRRYIDA